ncbi:MAG: winged helix DNA-binding protein [Pseudomonadota bacterium]
MAARNDAVEQLSPKPTVGPVVSSAHLARSAIPAQSEFEFALTMTVNAFHRWMTRCMTAAGEEGLSPLEVLVVHLVNHRDRPKTLADICLVLNIEDTHLVTYAVKKLAERGLVETGRKGKEKTVVITPKGTDVCTRYGELREALFIDAVKTLNLDGSDISKVAAMMRTLSGSYDQAARAAAAM